MSKHWLFKKGQSGNPNGRPKGKPNKTNRLTNEERKKLAEDDSILAPIQLLTSIAKDEREKIGNRMRAAQIVAPYLYQKKPIAIEGGDPRKPISVLNPADLRGMSQNELNTLLAGLQKAGGFKSATEIRNNAVAETISKIVAVAESEDADGEEDD